MADLKKTLAKLPKDLDETYDRIMQRIEAEDHFEDAILLMQWMCFSKRPLTLREAAEILTLQTEDEEFCSDNRLNDPKDVLTICSSLLECLHYEVEDDLTSSEPEHRLWLTLRAHACNKIVRLSHFSIKEYFLSDRCSFRERFEKDSCNILIAKGCLRYLLQTCEHGAMTPTLFKQLPLAKYASDNWDEHLQRIDCPDDVLELAYRLMNNEIGLLSCSRLSPSYWGIEWHRQASNLWPPICYAASKGIYRLVQTLIQRNPQSAEDCSLACVKAALHGFLDIVELLVESGADVNYYGEGTALWQAVRLGQVEVVKFLIEMGAHPTFYTGVWNSNNPESRETELCFRLLIDAGADLTKNFSRGNLHVDIMRKIFDKGIDVDIRDEQDRTALLNVCRLGSLDRAQFLIKVGADVNTCQKSIRYNDPVYQSPLFTAVHYGHPSMTEALIKAGARLPEEILHVAARTGNIQTISVLLNHGVDVDGIHGKYSTPLQLASLHGHEPAIKKLLATGANANLSGGVFGTALQAACCNAEVTMTLSTEPSEDFDVLAGGISFNSMVLVWRGPEVKIRLSLCFVAEGTYPDEEVVEQHSHWWEEKGGRKPFHEDEIVAAKIRKTGTGSIVQIQVDNTTALVRSDLMTAPYMAKDLAKVLSRETWAGCREGIRSSLNPWPYRSILKFPINEQETEFLTQTFLNLGGKIQPRSTNPTEDDVAPGDSPFDLVKALLDAGADVNAESGVYGYPLQAAARFGRLDACQLMLQRGAEVNLIGGVYGTALQAAAASFEENVPMIQQLLIAGADVDIVSGEFGCALSAACYRGHINIVRTLLKVGADVNLFGGTYGNPLQSACASRYATEELVGLLLEAGADDAAQGGKFGSAYGACLSKNYRAAIVMSERQYEKVLRGQMQKPGTELVGRNGIVLGQGH